MAYMTINSTLLCIHRDPAELGLLKENGYELVTTSNGRDGLRLVMSCSVDAVVLEHETGLIDGAAIAAELKRVRPQIPIVMLVDHLELPDGDLKSVDALVAKSDGAHFLWAAVHFVLNVTPAQRREAKLRAQTPVHLRRPGSLRKAADRSQANSPQSAITGNNEEPFSPGVWQSIRNGTIRF
jgi:response regulator RpfG family c-di-GMP phosphodiesterase